MKKLPVPRLRYPDWPLQEWKLVVTRGSAYNDADYVNAGAQIADSAEEIYSTCDFVAQVQECAKQRC